MGSYYLCDVCGQKYSDVADDPSCCICCWSFGGVVGKRGPKIVRTDGDARPPRELCKDYIPPKELDHE